MNCPTVYCLNTPGAANLVTTIAITDGGFVLAGGVPPVAPAESGFRVPFRSGVVFRNDSAVPHRVVSVDESWAPDGRFDLTINPAAAVTLNTAWQRPPIGVLRFLCPDHTVTVDDEAVIAKRGRLEVFYDGAYDLNQSNDGHGGGCCRVSLAIAAQMKYTGFADFTGAIHPRYLRRRYRTTIDGWDFSGLEVSDGTSAFAETHFVSGAQHEIVDRIRDPRFQIPARQEIIYTPDDGSFYKWTLGPLAPGYFLVRIPQPDNEDDPFQFWIYWAGGAGAIEQVSATRRRQVLYMTRIRGSAPDQTEGETETLGPVGEYVEEVDDPWLWSQFTAAFDELMQSAGSWDGVTFPGTTLDAAWYRVDASGDTRSGSGCVVKGADGFGPDPWDDAGSASRDSWPLPKTNGWCHDPDACGDGQISTGPPPAYGCIRFDRGNSVNGQYPANANSVPDGSQPVVRSVANDLWSVGPPFSPLLNACASGQTGLNIVSPVLHYPAGVTYAAASDGIMVTRTMVKRWWSAPFCRVVTRRINEIEEVIECAHDLTGDQESVAPCAWIDDPAQSAGRLNANAGFGGWALVAGWESQMTSGDVRGIFVEMSCPDVDAEHPCGHEVCAEAPAPA